jgi:hypothetical protein
LLGITESFMREDILAGRPYPILQVFKFFNLSIHVGSDYIVCA